VADRIFLVRKGALPDLYELYSSSGDVGRRVYLDALVPSLSISRVLRERFASLGVTDTLPMRCAWNERFRKWAPFDDPRPQDELPVGMRERFVRHNDGEARTQRGGYEPDGVNRFNRNQHVCVGTPPAYQTGHRA
jgi:hypothetical protein